MNDTILGILGGMGPEATADFYMKIIRATSARRDQDHFRVIIDSNVKIPDRTEAILGKGESPVDAMIDTARNLQKAGVEIACMPCMTSHFFIEEIQQHVNFPIMNVFHEVRKHIFQTYPKVTKLGVLATTGTIETGLFGRYMDNITVVYPQMQTQETKVMEAIYGREGIKSGQLAGTPLKLLQEAAGELIDSGAELIISGCTEIGLVLKPHHILRPLIDPMEIAAHALVQNSVEDIRNSLQRLG